MRKDPAVKIAAQRIDDLICNSYNGNVREAARIMGVDHVTLWRASKGYNVKGPSGAMCDALVAHAGRSTDYWRGKEV